MVDTLKKGLRRCIGCGKGAPKAQLFRVVRTPAQSVCFDTSGRAAGRGAYVCSEECFVLSCKKKKLDRALKRTLDNTEYTQIAADISAASTRSSEK